MAGKQGVPRKVTLGDGWLVIDGQIVHSCRTPGIVGDRARTSEGGIPICDLCGAELPAIPLSELVYESAHAKS